MAGIEKRKAPRTGWRIRWRDPDGTARNRSCATHAAAKALWRQVEEAEALGIRWTPPASERVPKLADMITAYLNDLCRTAKQSTIDSRRSQLGSFLAWCHREKKTTAAVLTRGNVQAFDGARAADGIELSTRSLGVSIISGFWEWCAGHDDYARHVGRPSVPKMPGRVVADPVAPLWEEVDALCEEAKRRAATDSRRVYAYRLALILRAFGLRVGQGLAVAAENCDWARGTIRIVTGKSRAESTGRTLPMPPWFAAEARSWGVEAGPLVGRAVPRAQASCYMHACWKALRVGPDGQPVRPEVYVKRPCHAFRKTIRTELEAARCREQAIKYWQGHSTGLGGRYTDPRAHDLLEIARTIPRPPCVPIGAHEDPADLTEALRKRSGR